MTLKTTLPSDDEIKKIADELDGLEETFSKSQKRVLEEFGYDHSIAQNEVFFRKLDEHVFHCDYCDQWKQTGMRVTNESAEDEMCEDCDENY